MNVYRLDDYTWYMGATLDEAIAKAMEDMQLERHEAADEDAAQVSEEELDRLHFTPDPYNKPEESHSFREELAKREPKAQFFASTEF